MSTRLFSSINKGYINITLPKMDFSLLWLKMTCCWCDDRYVWQIMRQQVIYSCLNGGNLLFFLANTGNHFLAQHPALTACDYRRDEGSCPFVRTSDGASGWLVQTGSNTHLLTRSLWQRWERRHFRRGATALRARACTHCMNQWKFKWRTYFSIWMHWATYSSVWVAVAFRNGFLYQYFQTQTRWPSFSLLFQSWSHVRQRSFQLPYFI